VVENEDKVSEIKLHYENIGALDKVKFQKNASDMLYSDYPSLSLMVSILTTHALKLDGQLKQEKEFSRAWQTQVKRLESEGPHGVKYSLNEKDKLIQSMKKKLNMYATENPQTTELASLEQEKETFRHEALNYKDKVLQLEKEKENWSQGQAVTSYMDVIVPSTTKTISSIDGLVQDMSQVILKTREIKSLKEVIEKLEKEMKMKDEKMSQFQN
jgi:hypothetical protein